MAKQASVVQDGVDQIRQAVRRADREFKKIQKQVEARRRRLAKEVTTRRRTIEKRAQRELERLQKQIQSQPLVKRADALRADAQERLGRSVSSLLDAFPLATRSDVERIDRKVTALGRKLKEIEKAQGGSAEAA
jgi:sensor histidine kinase YesM